MAKKVQRVPWLEKYSIARMLSMFEFVFLISNSIHLNRNVINELGRNV